MEIELLRLSDSNGSTIGALFSRPGTSSYRRLLCWTLEDERREVKVAGETRIPAGRYRITLRNEGGFHQRYAKKFGAWHRGMLWLRDVPGFDFILIHMGNTDRDTAGCILVGNKAVENVAGPGLLEGSEAAYRRIYPELSRWIVGGGELYITVRDVA